MEEEKNFPNFFPLPSHKHRVVIPWGGGRAVAKSGIKREQQECRGRQPFAGVWGVPRKPFSLFLLAAGEQKETLQQPLRWGQGCCKVGNKTRTAGVQRAAALCRGLGCP